MSILKIYDKWGNLALAILSVTVILVTLFAGETIGLSDNGDFGRVMRASSLEYVGARDPYVFTETFAITADGSSALRDAARVLFGRTGLRDYPSIHIIIVRISVAANLLFNVFSGNHIYHVGVLGVMYTLLYGAALFLLFRELKLKNRALDLCAKLLVILILCDVGYVSYFNSLYTEPVQMIGLVLLTAATPRILNREQPTFQGWLLLCFAAVLYGWSKFANIPVACLALVAGAFVLFRKHRKIQLPALTMVPLALLLGVYTVVPGWMDAQTNFNAVFYGIVKDVDEQTGAAYLEDLRLPREMIAFAGASYYGDGVYDRFREAGFDEAFSQIKKTDLFLFYLSHPKALLKGLRISIENSAMIRPFYLGNYGQIMPRLTFSNRFALWSRLRQWLGTGTVYGGLGVVLAFFASIILRRRRSKSHWIALIALALALLYNAAVPIMANGEGDLAKHMFAWVQMVDLMLLFVLIWSLDTLLCRGERATTALAGLMIVGLLIAPISQAWSQYRLTVQKHAEIEQGAYVKLGRYDGSELVWLVTDIENGNAALLAVSDIGRFAFDAGNNNQWGVSDARRWLNEDFLRDFTFDERALLQSIEHMVVLPSVAKASATSGEMAFPCFHTPAYAARGYDRAYSAPFTDTVALPSIRLISRLHGLGYDVSGDYWLETPYFGNPNMVRYAALDGYLYFKDAEELSGLRPVITIPADLPVTGVGVAKDAFIISEHRKNAP